MKAMKKLIPAVAMLLVSVVTMSTASFAWFSMSRQVTAEGMNVTVSAPTNLQIKADSADAYEVDGIATITLESTATKLVPASTVNGSTFYIVDTANTPDTGVTSGGGALATGAVLKTGTNTDGAYVDFVYTIKNGGDTSVNVAVKSITVTDNSSGKSMQPVRVAVQKADNSWILFAPNSAATNHQTSGKAISSYDADSKTVATADVTYVSLASAYSADIATLAQKDATATITIRVWYEGEDKQCTDANGAASFGVSVVLTDSSAPRS